MSNSKQPASTGLRSRHSPSRCSVMSMTLLRRYSRLLRPASMKAQASVASMSQVCRLPSNCPGWARTTRALKCRQPPVSVRTCSCSAWPSSCCGGMSARVVTHNSRSSRLVPSQLRSSAEKLCTSSASARAAPDPPMRRRSGRLCWSRTRLSSQATTWVVSMVCGDDGMGVSSGRACLNVMHLLNHTGKPVYAIKFMPCGTFVRRSSLVRETPDADGAATLAGWQHDADRRLPRRP